MPPAPDDGLLRQIAEVGARLGLAEDRLVPYGRFKAKIADAASLSPRPDAKLILVTATTPNKSGSGKTATTVALAMGLERIGRRAVAALREPSLGPCFGMKGGATGGGKAQLYPSDEINLHFTGDFHAITAANNLLAALVDNHAMLHAGTPGGLKSVAWRRVLDVNDRALRQIVTGLGSGNGVPTETGFDITAASEIMAILCLATDREDLRAGLGRIVVGRTNEGKNLTAGEIGATGALLVLLKDAFDPNLVQTIEGTPAIVHGGPFANIAHGCNSIVATRAALALGEFVVTEAGFGSDLGAEKFLNIKCRAAGLCPAASVLVTSTQSLKLHGGAPEARIQEPNPEALRAGLANLARHLGNLRNFGQPVVVALNRFAFDAEDEIAILCDWCGSNGAPFAVNDGFARGGEGAESLARAVAEIADSSPAREIRHTYALSDPAEEKLNQIVRQVYGGEGVTLAPAARASLRRIEAAGYGELPVCVAKTQYSFTGDSRAVGAASGFRLEVQDLLLSAGAGFLVAMAGEIVRMPGLPKEPQALKMDLVDSEVRGLA